MTCACRQYFQQERLYDEPTFWSNVKLTLMSIAAVLCAVAQFYPLPFPENKQLLTVCSLGFFAINGVLYVLSWVVDGDYLCVLQPVAASPEITAARKKRKRKAHATKAQSVHAALPELRLTTDLPRYDDAYTIILEAVDSEGSKREIGRVAYSVGEFFTKDGSYAEDRFWDTVDAWTDKVLSTHSSKKGN